MHALIKIDEEIIGGDKVQAVDARELYEFLEVKTPFRKWISRRIDELQLVVNRDFISTDKIVRREIGGSVSKEYIVTIDTAKHLAMIERNEKGFQIRDYFIRVEKEARLQKDTVLENPIVKLAMEHAILQEEQSRQLQMIIDQQNQIDHIQNDMEYKETYFKVRAFVKMRGLRMTDNDMKTFGRRAAKLSRAKGYEVDKAPCANFGYVGRYHVDILEEVLKSW